MTQQEADWLRLALTQQMLALNIKGV
jgi:hypothetical protein